MSCNPAPAPVDWERRWRECDTPWDKGAAAPPLLEWLGGNRMPGPVLVPGCGSGHDVRAIAASGGNPLGIDISPTAVARANSIPVVGLERYREADFLNLPADLAGRFDWVFEHTCFCAIDPGLRNAYVDSLTRALAPDGQFLAIFYMDPSHNDGPPFRVSRDELERYFGGAFELLSEKIPSCSFDGREGRELLRHYRRQRAAALNGLRPSAKAV